MSAQATVSTVLVLPLNFNDANEISVPAVFAAIFDGKIIDEA